MTNSFKKVNQNLQHCSLAPNLLTQKSLRKIRKNKKWWQQEKREKKDFNSSNSFIKVNKRAKKKKKIEVNIEDYNKTIIKLLVGIIIKKTIIYGFCKIKIPKIVLSTFALVTWVNRKTIIKQVLYI